MKNQLNLNPYLATAAAPLFENKIDQNLETKNTLAEKLKYSISNINKLMKLRKIPYLKIGKSVRFRFYDVMAALEQESAV